MFFLTMAIHTGCAPEFDDTITHQSDPFATNQMLPGTVYCASRICHIVLLHILTLNLIQISATPGCGCHQVLTAIYRELVRVHQKCLATKQSYY